VRLESAGFEERFLKGMREGLELDPVSSSSMMKMSKKMAVGVDVVEAQSGRQRKKKVQMM
jgi:hypothetical protein